MVYYGVTEAFSSLVPFPPTIRGFKRAYSPDQLDREGTRMAPTRRRGTRVAPAITSRQSNNQNKPFSDKSLSLESCNVKKPFALKVSTIRRIFETIETRFAEIITLSKKIYTGNARFSCPVHGHNRFVVNNGHDANGAQKCICKGKHARENIIRFHVAPNIEFVVYREVTSADSRLYFRSTTSYDSILVPLFWNLMGRQASYKSAFRDC